MIDEEDFCREPATSCYCHTGNPPCGYCTDTILCEKCGEPVEEDVCEKCLQARKDILEAAIKDAEWRIGSHVLSTKEIDDYVLDQFEKIERWMEELNG